MKKRRQERVRDLPFSVSWKEVGKNREAGSDDSDVCLLALCRSNQFRLQGSSTKERAEPKRCP